MDLVEIGTICYSVVSCCFSLGVIFTILFFKSMQKGNFLPIILYMSISDVGLNLASALGFPNNGTAACWIQGLAQNYFALSGWFWTTILTYRVYCFVRYGRCRLKKRFMHLIAWGLPLFLTFIPLTTTNYGNDGGGRQTCVYSHRPGSAEWLVTFWRYTTFFGWLFICIILMFVWQLITYFKFRHTQMKALVGRTYDKVYLYPIAMMTCWSLSFCSNALSLHSTVSLRPLNVFFGISTGVLSALIFLVKSEEARRRWQAYFTPPCRDTIVISIDATIRPDFELDGDDDDWELDSAPPQSSLFTQDVEISDITMSDYAAQNPVHEQL